MHFLGFNVMQRRIPDFPDSFHSWNFLSSIGSGITFLSFAIFFLFLFLIVLENYCLEFYQHVICLFFLQIHLVSSSISFLLSCGSLLIIIGIQLYLGIQQPVILGEPQIDQRKLKTGWSMAFSSLFNRLLIKLILFGHFCWEDNNWL